jgi:hypothetical protein
MANGNELDDQCLWTTRRQFRLDVLSTRHVPSPRYHLHRQAITFDFCEFDRFLFLRNLGSATNDMIGRRTKLWVGSIVLSCLFACVTGFSSQFGVGMPVNLPVSNAGIASVSQISSMGA